MDLYWKQLQMMCLNKWSLKPNDCIDFVCRPKASIFMAIFYGLFQGFSLVSWNVRGALGSSRKRKIWDLVYSHKPSLFLVYESTHGLFVHVEKFWTSLGYKLVFIQEAARGQSGIIWVLFSRDDIHFSMIDNVQQVITFSIHRLNATWFCSTNVYASPIPSVRCGLWDHFIFLRSIISGP